MYRTKLVTTKDDATGISVTTSEVDIDYVESYVAYLDVLGFKEMVWTHSEDNITRLKEYYNIVGYFKKAIQEIPEKMEIRFTAISDSVILTMPLSDQVNHVDQLKHFLIVVGLMQQHLAMKAYSF